MNLLNEEEQYWTNRYQTQNTGWDIGYPSTPIKEYIDQLTKKDIDILIPGAGNAYEAEYLIAQGYCNVYVLDIATIPLLEFKQRNPSFPDKQMIAADFFTHQGQYDLIIEQTFFCSFPPTTENRERYAQHMHKLLKPNGKLVGLWFDIPLIEGNIDKRPFGGTKEMYLTYLAKYFEVQLFEKCYNSIKQRMGQELFGIFRK